MTCSYAEACSPHTPNPALKAPPPPPSPERDVQEDPMTRLSNRLDELEKQLLQVTAERDSLHVILKINLQVIVFLRLLNLKI